MGLHAFTGCDSTSAFKGKGKVKAIKLMLKNKDILDAAARLGNEWSISKDTLSTLQQLTCSLYGMPQIDSVNECRYNKLTALCCTDNLNVIQPSKKFDTAFIPPAYVSFVEHVKRVNYQVGIWKRSHQNFPVIPIPTEDQGWITNDNGVLQPKWFSRDMLPQTIINELSSDDNQTNTEDDEVIDEADKEDIDIEQDYSMFISELFNESDDEEFEGFDDDEMF